MSSHVDDFNTRNKVLTSKLLRQGYRYHKIRKAFSKLYRRHFDIVSIYNVGLKTLLLEGLSEPEFYRDLVYIDVLRQTACLVVNPIKDNGFAYLFNCMTVGQASN